jgi:hypothetical protein
MSEWKLRRLIQEGAFPDVQHLEEGTSFSMFAFLTA